MQIPPLPTAPPAVTPVTPAADPTAAQKRFDEAREREEQTAALREREAAPPPTRATDADPERRIGRELDVHA